MLEINCPVCNKPFLVKKSRLKRSKNVCCSLDCSSTLKKVIYLGSNNPNSKSDYDRGYFKDIDTEIKAYILGLIASDGTIKEDSIIIKLHNRDIFLLKLISYKTQGIFKFKSGTFFSRLLVCSKEMSADVCRHLSIFPGKKDSVVTFPEEIDDKYKWSFIRGFFDGDGSIKYPVGRKSYPQCNISSNSKNILNNIQTYCKIPCTNNHINKLEWYGNNAIDFLGMLYDNASIFLNRKRDLYIQISMWVPSLNYGSGIRGRESMFYWSKTKDNGVAPYKSHASDSGFDLTLVEKIKKVGKIEYYSTNIKIRPAYGWYFDLVPRSSMPKTGYCLANDIGIIDRTYTGPIIAALTKFDEKAEDIVLPAKIVQIIPRQIINPHIIYVNDFEDTSRNDGGFGSTGV